MRSRWARIGTRRTHRVRRRCSPWTLGSSPRRPPLELAVTRRRLISRAGEQHHFGRCSGCVRRSCSRHGAVSSPWWGAHLSLAAPLDASLHRTLPASARCSNSGGLPESVLCSRLAAAHLVAAVPLVAAVAPKSLARVAGLSASSPDRRPPRRCYFGSRHSPPLVTLAGLMIRRLAPGLRAAAALPPLELLAAERGLPPLL